MLNIQYLIRWFSLTGRFDSNDVCSMLELLSFFFEPKMKKTKIIRRLSKGFLLKSFPPEHSNEKFPLSHLRVWKYCDFQFRKAARFIEKNWAALSNNYRFKSILFDICPAVRFFPFFAVDSIFALRIVAALTVSVCSAHHTVPPNSGDTLHRY